MVISKNAYKAAKLNKYLENLIKTNEKYIYPNLYTLFKTALVLLILFSSCERSFSVMRRINTWNKTTMGQNKLTDLVVIFIDMT